MVGRLQLLLQQLAGQGQRLIGRRLRASSRSAGSFAVSISRLPRSISAAASAASLGDDLLLACARRRGGLRRGCLALRPAPRRASSGTRPAAPWRRRWPARPRRSRAAMCCSRFSKPAAIGPQANLRRITTNSRKTTAEKIARSPLDFARIGVGAGMAEVGVIAVPWSS